VPDSLAVAVNYRVSEGPRYTIGRVDYEGTGHLRESLARRELLQRTDVVRNPDSTRVSGDDEVAVARMDQDVVDARRRQVVHELLPLPAAVERMWSPNPLPTYRLRFFGSSRTTEYCRRQESPATDVQRCP
jgi:hypothetical protein